ncbi:MAG: NUDIX domain-containing protein [Clostridia bacterium]|nr:NUDIX domain-containing protein [Clostridia bacterium]
MRHTYCPDCGAKLAERPVGDEGLVPWCRNCGRPWFDSFSTCIITAVMNDRGEVLLQRETRRPEREVLVAGYIKPGESAEDAARREIAEETGLTVTALRYVASYPHMNGDMLMLGYAATAEGENRTDSGEILSARWTTLDEAVAALREGSIAQQVVRKVRDAQDTHNPE